MERLRQRADFLAAATGSKVPATAFVLQARKRSDDGPVRVGFTVSKKIGNAVTRNRIRRRLKAAVAATAGQHARTTCDYVIVARLAALDRPFTLLLDDVTRAFTALHDNAKRVRTDNARSASRRTGALKGST